LRREAMREKNVNKLLMIFLELGCMTEGEHLTEVFKEAVRERRQNELEGSQAN
jgi:hypothetical protein